MPIFSKKAKSLFDVPPIIKYIYWGRLVYCIFAIMPFFSVFYQRNLEFHFYLIFILQNLIWPHFAYLTAYSTKEPKKFEFIFNMHFEGFMIGIWAPICFFNPMICLFLLFATICAMMAGVSITLLAIRTISLLSGSLFGGIIFGFHFSSSTNISTVIWTGIGILGGTFITSLLFIRANKFIVSTRRKLKEQKEKLDEELEEAAAYVKTMLPLPIHEGPVQIDWRFIPSASLGGDAFGYQWLDDNSIAIYLLDVSGHGVGAALLSVSVLNTLRSQSLPNTNFKEPAHVLKALNSKFPSDDNNDMFFTFWYGVYDSSKRSLTYASAGHPPALLFSNEMHMIKLSSGNSVIGGLPDVSYSQKVQKIDIGASLYIYSDGVYEIEKKDGSMWSFNDYLSLISDLNSDEHSSLDIFYEQTIQIGKGEAFEDDYTILKAVFL
jgi:serine phosphatase RsbU (regulator of sigma subunit)